MEGHVAAVEAQLGFDECPVGFAVGGRELEWGRWRGWGNLISCGSGFTGGHPGRVCLESLLAFGVGANGLSVDSGDTFNLAVTGVGRQQRFTMVVCGCGFKTFNPVFPRE